MEQALPRRNSNDHTVVLLAVKAAPSVSKSGNHFTVVFGIGLRDHLARVIAFTRGLEPVIMGVPTYTIVYVLHVYACYVE